MYSIIIVILILLFIPIFFRVAPFAPTKKPELVELDKIIKQQKIKRFMDLGCGNGRVIDFLAKNNPEISFSGIEYSFILYLICKIRFWRCNNVRIYYGNLFSHDWSKYDALYLFWMPRALEKYQDKFLKKIIPGQTVLSYVFPIKFLQTNLISQVRAGKRDLPTYCYQIK